MLGAVLEHNPLLRQGMRLAPDSQPEGASPLRALLEEEHETMTRFKKLLVLMMFAAVLASGFLLGCSKDLG